MPNNHWNDDGDLVVEQKTLFRLVGWLTHTSKRFCPVGSGIPYGTEGFSPVYQQIATWVDGDWHD
jgi:hypothetical protein